MSPEQQALVDQIAANTSVINSAKALIDGIADRITAAGVDRQALGALVASLKADDDGLAESVRKNTVAATEPVTEPVVGRRR